MEDLALLDLLECPLCLEPLDVTAKVLPCQHTFCKPCLQRQEQSSRSGLRCPECRSPVARAVEELPTNLLLVRLLEGFQHGPLGAGTDKGHVDCVPRQGGRDTQSHQYTQELESDRVYSRISSSNQQHDKSKSGDRNMKPGDVMGVGRKEDENRRYADVKAGGGLQLDNNMQQQLPLCTALCDFGVTDLDPRDFKDCLTFLKGDVITVIQRVDDNWVEGHLEDKVGIFPLQFTELNSVASRLLERRREQEYSSADSWAQIGRRKSGGGDGHGHERGATTSASVQRQASLLAQRRASAAGPSRATLLNSLNRPSAGTGAAAYAQQPLAPKTGPAPAAAATLVSAPAKLHRAVHGSKHRRSSSLHRGQRQTDRKMNTPSTVTMALMDPQDHTSLSDKQSPTQQLSISVCAALYSYKPQRFEELELCKGEMVGVYGKFKEGWLQGLSLRSGKVGILPSNYVTPVLRTSARFVESKSTPSSVSTGAGKRHGAQKPLSAVLDQVNNANGMMSAAAGQGHTVALATQPVMSSHGVSRSAHSGAKHSWEIVRRAFHSTHKGSVRRGNHQSHLTPSLQPPSTDLGQIYSYGRSPVLPRKRNGLFSNPMRPQQCWTTDTLPPSGGGYQTVYRDAFHKEASSGPLHSILVKPDSNKYNTDKPVKTVRFLTEETPQLGSWTTPLSSGRQLYSGSQSSPPIMELWNPSAILGRDGNSSVLKDIKTSSLKKSFGLDHAYGDGSPFSLKSSVGLNSPSRHRVVIGYSARTDAEINLSEGEMVLVQRPRLDGRILVTQETTGRTGLFQGTVLGCLEKLM
ncbi:E3 ubiquitin-protein ligase SH3RF2 isoform X2 [Alosa sapidissima]|uniref:E3 ubiquitin-protein ligase SH3RF2 isoform X2 n=1 Tax=Alosa sapidissima TaxID=34773 RepID=UPI001C08804D|nr:E3 ubiquitin-protein ligase SH3RF2 isoform X2 [Alosa sapidissima]